MMSDGYLPPCSRPCSCASPRAGRLLRVGVTFINLEDETGILNVTCSPGLFLRSKKTVRTSSALLVRGIVEKADGVINLVADKLVPLKVPVRPSSRDWR
jgi:error-prone DNA polymerase